ncbi:MAG: PEP-CTERM sorting domain-containing protein [Verrucomicrobia bacterium]|nr:MAG: PEP-CTERM sorting domain-containing protein [Verrucomicrobiota bacterium]
MKIIFTLTVSLFLIFCTSSIGDIFGGIEFPKGALSFADEVVSYDPTFSGYSAPTGPNFIDPSAALGVPNYSGGGNGTGAVALGAGGRIVLKFADNKLTGSDSSAPDLHIFEIGADVEDTFVEISADGIIWHSVGKVFGATSSIDIDAFGFGTSSEFSYVRLMDDPNQGGVTTGYATGADIDAVGAISTIPEPSSTAMIGLVSGLGLFIRRKFML